MRVKLCDNPECKRAFLNTDKKCILGEMYITGDSSMKIFDFCCAECRNRFRQIYLPISHNILSDLEDIEQQ